MANPNLVVPAGFSQLEEDLEKAASIQIRYLDASGRLQQLSVDASSVTIRYRAEIVIWDSSGYCYCQDIETVVPVEKLVTANLEVRDEPADSFSRLWVRGPSGELIAAE